MRITLLSLMVAFILLTVSPANAQTPTFKDGFGFQYLLIDYNTPIQSNQAAWKDHTNGFEISYARNINKFFNINIPLRGGFANLPREDGTFNKSEFFWGADALLEFQFYNEDNFVVPFIYAGMGGLSYEDKSTNIQIPTGGGLKFAYNPTHFFVFKMEYRNSLEARRDNLQYSVGFQALVGEAPPKEMPKVVVTPSDRDNDGVIDTDDTCPDVAGLAAFSGCPDTDEDGIADKDDACPEVKGTLAMNGCPDMDGDGITDKDDQCPEAAGPASNNGCPEVKDADGDGVPDDSDLCPNDAGIATLGGCPDKDGDGVMDKEDRCPNEPGLRAFNGCPDTDGDGVENGKDKCPNTVGTVANSGCPEIKKEEQKVLDLAMSAVQFETGSGRLKASSYEVLDKIINILNKYPAYNCSISGHTDSVGGAATNQALSEKRAKSCYDYITKRVSANRVSHTGYGETQPIADNKYKEGRKKNRRVEFNLYLK